jgi:hypothetical protein
MKHVGVPQAITAYAIPPHAPPEVAEAKDEFDAIAKRWAGVKGELQDAKEALTAAKTADLQAIVDAAEEGKDVKDAQANQRKVEALIADLEVRLKGLDMAVHEAGDRLAQSIADHCKQWLPRLADAEADAAVRFDQAMAEARAALDELRPARGAVDWLNRFDPDLAYVGQVPQFTGGRLRVKSRGGVLKGEFNPTELLDLAARVTNTEDTPTTPTMPGQAVVKKVAAHA